MVVRRKLSVIVAFLFRRRALAEAGRCTFPPVPVIILRATRSRLYL